jgi:hypothetical protein
VAASGEAILCFGDLSGLKLAVGFADLGPTLAMLAAIASWVIVESAT